jgi:bifunctional DNA-binding transcriptional regulator/antitoxin component of YhaV-PrlF toxin-antitoxin module
MARVEKMEGRFQVIPEIKGTVVGVRQIQNRGRVQIPKTIKDELKLADGDSVYWVRDANGKFYIAKAIPL